MPTGERTDPFRAYNFLVEFDDLAATAFSEVSGLSSEGEPVEYREGPDAVNTVRKLIGLRTYANVTLKRGYTSGDVGRALWEWYMDIVNGVNNRKNGTITLRNEEGNPVMRWSIENAWPNKIVAPTFNASSNDVAMEELELCHEGLELEPPVAS